MTNLSQETAHSLCVLGDHLVALEERVLDCEKQRGLNNIKFRQIMFVLTGLAHYDLETLSKRKPLELKRWVLVENT